MVWIEVNPERLGDRKIPCFFWPSDLVEIMVKPVITCLLCWPSDMVWIVVNHGFY